MNTIWFDGIEFAPLIDYEIVVKDYYISRCAKVLNYHTKKYINPYENYRSKKLHGGFKSMRFNFSYAFLILTTILNKAVLKLILYGIRIRINQSYPGNIGN